MLEARILKRLGPAEKPSFVLDFELSAEPGITILFGPSGSGKSTALKCIAGILSPDSGRIVLDGKVFFDSAAGNCVPVQKRRIGFVFQDCALFPHMSARRNVAYGLNKRPGISTEKKVGELISLLGIESSAEKYPAELSGGEQQRVALARALASEPRLMLLDEPLSAVDVGGRRRLLEEIETIQAASGIPFIYVTHNHSEAVRIGKNMVLMDGGRVIQTGPPSQLFNAPASVLAAHSVGTENIFEGRIVRHDRESGITTVDIAGCLLDVPYNGLQTGEAATLGIRSEDIIVAQERLTRTSARNILEGTVRRVVRDAENSELVVDCGIDFKVSITPAAVQSMGLGAGARVYLLVKARAIHLLN
jgi:molybdate transport system ATP-binding protein